MLMHAMMRRPASTPSCEVGSPVQAGKCEEAKLSSVHAMRSKLFKVEMNTTKSRSTTTHCLDQPIPHYAKHAKRPSQLTFCLGERFVYNYVLKVSISQCPHGASHLDFGRLAACLQDGSVASVTTRVLQACLHRFICFSNYKSPARLLKFAFLSPISCKYSHTKEPLHSQCKSHNVCIRHCFSYLVSED